MRHFATEAVRRLSHRITAGATLPVKEATTRVSSEQRRSTALHTHASLSQGGGTVTRSGGRKIRSPWRSNVRRPRSFVDCAAPLGQLLGVGLDARRSHSGPIRWVYRATQIFRTAGAKIGENLIGLVSVFVRDDTMRHPSLENIIQAVNGFEPDMIHEVAPVANEFKPFHYIHLSLSRSASRPAPFRFLS